MLLVSRPNYQEHGWGLRGDGFQQMLTSADEGGKGVEANADIAIINRPSVAGAVLQSPPSVINLLIN